MAKSKTVQAYNGWRAGKYGLLAGSLVSMVTPATVMTAVNWDDWFGKASWSLPWGFASLLITLLVAIGGYINSDVVFKKKDVAIYYVAILMACIGVTCLFLASLLEQMGYMWLATSAGVLGGAVCVTAEKKAVEPNIELYKGLIDENVLSKKAKKRQAKINRARAEAEREREEAVE